MFCVGRMKKSVPQPVDRTLILEVHARYFWLRDGAEISALSPASHDYGRSGGEEDDEQHLAAFKVLRVVVRAQNFLPAGCSHDAKATTTITITARQLCPSILRKEA